MISKLTKAVINKHVIVIAIAVMVVLAYVVPYGMDVEAKNLKNNGKNDAYGHAYGHAFGHDCSHFKNKGPVRCR